MAQIFRPGANTFARWSLLALVLFPAVIGGAAYLIYRSPLMTTESSPPRQPVPFSHAHHVSGLGIDCRYCHTTVEQSAFAGIPPTKTCMTCHSQIWSDSQMLQPVRKSFAEKKPLQWVRVHDLPDFVYFNHSMHVNNGVGCSSCHGRVDLMPLTFQTNSLYMKWCLDCHENPGPQLREPGEIYQMTWSPEKTGRADDEQLIERYGINTAELIECYACHR